MNMLKYPGKIFTRFPRLAVISALMFTSFLAALDQTILSTSLPVIAGDLGGLQDISWVIVAYTVAMTIGMPLYGKLGDQFGHKLLFSAGIGIFILGSGLSALAQSMNFLIFGRFIQGFGAAGIVILSQAILADITTVRERAKYAGLFGMVFGVSSIGGPFLGGFLTETFSWHWNFWINVPLGIIALAVILKKVQLPHSIKSYKVDYAGIVLMSAAVTSLTLAASWAGTRYDWSSPQIIAVLVIFAIAAAGFIWVETKTAEPILPLDFFKNRTFAVCTVAGVTVGAGIFGVTSYLPTYFQVVQNASVIVSGMLVLPMLTALFVGTVVSGWIISKTGHYRAFPATGLAISAAGLFLMSTMTTETSLMLTIVYTVIFGLGLGLSAQNIIFIVQNAMPAKAVGAATASTNFFREIGVSLGIAVFGAIFASRVIAGNVATDLMPEAIHAMSRQEREATVGIYAEALSAGFFWLVPFLLIGFIVTLFIPSVELSAETGQERRLKEESL